MTGNLEYDILVCELLMHWYCKGWYQVVSDNLNSNITWSSRRHTGTQTGKQGNLQSSVGYHWEDSEDVMHRQQDMVHLHLLCGE